MVIGDIIALLNQELILEHNIEFDGELVTFINPFIIVV